MKKNPKPRYPWPLLALLVASLMPVAAAAEGDEQSGVIRVRFETEDRTRPEATREVDLIYLAPGAVRLDTEFNEDSEPQFSTLYRSGKGFLYLMHDSGEAVLQDRQQSELYAKRLEAARKRALERMGGASEERLQAIEKSQQAAVAQQVAQAEAMKLEKTDETGETHGHRWTKFRESHDGVTTREILVISWQDLGASPEVSQLFEEIGLFHADLRKLFGRGPAGSAFGYYHDLGGLPLQSQQFDANGNVVLEARITAIDILDLPENLFENPGYPQTGMADRLPDVGEVEE